jgi:hypothetical protein
MKLPRDQGSFKCWASVIRPSDESSRWLQSRWVSSPVIPVPCKVPPLETRATGRQGVENRHWGPSVQPLGSTVFSLASLSSLAKNKFLVHDWKKRSVDFLRWTLASKLVLAFELQTFPKVFCPLQTKDVKVQQEQSPPVPLQQTQTFKTLLHLEVIADKQYLGPCQSSSPI